MGHSMILYICQYSNFPPKVYRTAGQAKAARTRKNNEIELYNERLFANHGVLYPHALHLRAYAYKVDISALEKTEI
jgi:hypothetical protein